MNKKNILTSLALCLLLAGCNKVATTDLDSSTNPSNEVTFSAAPTETATIIPTESNFPKVTTVAPIATEASTTSPKTTASTKPTETKAPIKTPTKIPAKTPTKTAATTVKPTSTPEIESVFKWLDVKAWYFNDGDVRSPQWGIIVIGGVEHEYAEDTPEGWLERSFFEITVAVPLDLEEMDVKIEATLIKNGTPYKLQLTYPEFMRGNAGDYYVRIVENKSYGGFTYKDGKFTDNLTLKVTATVGKDTKTFEQKITPETLG